MTRTDLETQQIERSEEAWKKKRMHTDSVNKKNNSKALKVLGHDPSTHKVERTLGETLQKPNAPIKYQGPLLSQKDIDKLLASGMVFIVILLLLFINYLYESMTQSPPSQQ
jgi:hypothetical protein